MSATALRQVCPRVSFEAVDGQPIGRKAGSCGTAAFRREPVVVEDIATDPLWEIIVRALPQGLRACWSTPIFDGHRARAGYLCSLLPAPQSRPTGAASRLVDLSRTRPQSPSSSIAKPRRCWRARSDSGSQPPADTLALGMEHRDLIGSLWSDELKAIFGWPEEMRGSDVRDGGG